MRALACLLSLLLVACDDAPVDDAGAPGGDAGVAAVDAGAGGDAGPGLDAGEGGDAAAGATWRTEPPVPDPVQEIAVAAHGGEIYVAGGFVRGAVVPNVYVFDPGPRRWRRGPDLPAPRHHMMLVDHQGDLYAIGGMRTLAFAPLDSVWVLRAGASAWEEVASLPDDRGAGGAYSLGDVIVVAGGNRESGRLANDTLIYEPSADRWRFGAPIPTEREHLAAVGYGGELYVLAGRRNSLGSTRSELEIYDPVADAWRAGPSLPSPRGGFAAAVAGDAIYAHGGEEPRLVYATMDRLDLATMRWTPMPPTPTPHHGHGAAALDGRLYVIAGGDEPAFAAIDVVESLPLD